MAPALRGCTLLLVLAYALGAACSSGLQPCGNGLLDDGERCDPASSTARCPAYSTCGHCPEGTEACGDDCAVVAADPRHCGACGNVCANGEVCAAGSCDLSCQTGLFDCGGTCRDLATDERHCGTCFATCVGDQQCAASVCRASCASPTLECAGACVDPSLDAAHCGACGIACTAPAHAAPVCVQGICDSVCLSGFADCNLVAADGCEVDLTSSSACGACGMACAPLPHAPSSSCAAGVCLPACAAGWDNCNSVPVDGCEADLTAESSCGACGLVCGGATPNCVGGVCVSSDLAGVHSTYPFEGRTVYLWRTPTCADLTGYTGFCAARGLTWWRPRSAADAQQLVDHAFSLDSWHTWVQVHGLATGAGTIGGFPVTTDDPSCVGYSSGADWGAFRKWACSFCLPSSHSNQSCCWDPDHAYDWFVCE